MVGAALLAYQNSFTGPFIYDDESSILTNPTIRHLWPIGNVLSPPHGGGLTVEGRPVINLSLAINYALGGTKVWGYHALNLIVHILAGLTLYGVVRRTLLSPKLRDQFGAGADGLALAVALLWTVHPLQTESVTYVIQRAEMIMGLFYLLTLYCFIRAAESPRPGPWNGLCVAACALGMASKEVMATAPIIVLLYDRAFLSGSFSEAWRRRWRLYLTLASTWILLGYLILRAGSFGNAVTTAKSTGFTWWQYLAAQPGAILHYLRVSVWPYPLCFDYYGWPAAQTWLNVGLPALAIILLLGVTAWALKRNSIYGFLGAWFFVILAPSSSVVPLDSPVYEHRLYLPLAGIVVLAVMGIRALAGRRTLAVTVALTIGLVFLTWRRNLDYRSELSIWQDTVVKHPQNPRAHTNLGLALVHAGRFQEAIGHYEQALRIKPDSSQARYDLEIALARTSKVEEAIRHYEQALQIKPDSAEAHKGLGLVLAQAGRTEAAIGHFEQAVRLKPEDAGAYKDLAVALIQRGRTQEAIDNWKRSLRLKPDDAEMQYSLGNALVALRRMPEAVEHFQQALRIKPDYVEALDNLAWLLATLAPADGGDPGRAVTLAERACKLTDHKAAPYLDTLATAYAAVGRFNDATVNAQKAVELARATGQPQLVAEIEAHLQLYRNGQPYRPDALNK